MESWVALPGSQQLFLSCPIREALYSGTRGAAKTDGLLMSFAQHVGRGFGSYWRGVIFRKTYKQLGDLIAKSKRWLPRIFPKAVYNGSEYEWRWPTGETLLLRHMASPDDYSNYHGHEYPFIGWEELTQWIDLECYDLMMGCNRSPHPSVPRIVRGTTNPYGRGHNIVKRRFIDPAPPGTVIVDALSPHGRVLIHGTVEENFVLLGNDPDYLRQLEAIQDPNRRKAWRFGSWDISSGGMFDDLWDASVHVVRTHDIPADWKIDRGHDWGSSRPSATLWFAESDGVPFAEQREGEKTGRTLWYPRGHIIVVDELYTWTGKENEGTRATPTKVAELIVRREESRHWTGRVRPGPADASIYSSEPDEKSIADKMKAKGAHFVPSFKGPGSRIRGWQLVRELLASSVPDEETGRQEEPGLSVFDRCTNTIRTLPSLPRDETDMDDVDTEAEDHIGDVVRYKALARIHKAQVEEFAV